MKICEDTREEFERELLTTLILQPDSWNYLVVKPMYFKNEYNQKMFKMLIDCYKKHKIINISLIVQENGINEWDYTDFYVELVNDTLFFKDNWKNQMQLQQESVLTFYKQDVIKDLNKKLEIGNITYEEFTDKIEKIKQIKINNKDEKNAYRVMDINTSKNKKRESILSNTKNLDNYVKGFTLGQLSVWSGSNASGKTSYLNQLILEGINQGYKTMVYSGELVPERLLNWLIMQAAGKKNMKYNRQDDYYYVDDTIKEKIKMWLDGKLLIYNNEYDQKAKVIIDSIKMWCLKEDIKVVVIDNLMSMDLNKYSDNKYDAQSDLIKDLSQLAKSLNIHIHFVCHPRKVTSFLRKIDISGSSDLTNIADNVFITHRVNVDFKNRTKEMFQWKDSNELYNFSNIIEICKNRDFGVEDKFVGTYYEIESKRFKDYENEERKYGWEDL